MRIISKFSDYYDGVTGGLIDNALIYNREVKRFKEYIY